jgi:hypothetical protein
MRAPAAPASAVLRAGLRHDRLDRTRHRDLDAQKVRCGKRRPPCAPRRGRLVRQLLQDARADMRTLGGRMHRRGEAGGA